MIRDQTNDELRWKGATRDYYGVANIFRDFTEATMKKYLLIELCLHRGQEEIQERRAQLNEFKDCIALSKDERAESLEYDDHFVKPLSYSRWGHKRCSAQHPTICEKEEIITARALANLMIDDLGLVRPDQSATKDEPRARARQRRRQTLSPINTIMD